VLRVYLQIYVEHSNRLERLGRSMPAARIPTLVPLKNPLIRVFSGLVFYLVLPMAMILFAWKAAVFPAWGSGLLCAAVGVIASHAVLPLGNVPWRSKALVSVSAAIVAGGVMFSFGPFRRPFDLYHANLSTQWLEGDNLNWAILSRANLSNANLRFANLNTANMTGTNLSNTNLYFADLHGANLFGANLSDADLSGANLSDSNLIDANLHGADLHAANLSNADLDRANLDGANLSGANLSGASLSSAKGLSEACGNVNTKLPEGFTVKPCPVEP
jgi:hypothetical protein